MKQVSSNSTDKNLLNCEVQYSEMTTITFSLCQKYSNSPIKLVMDHKYKLEQGVVGGPQKECMVENIAGDPTELPN